MSMSAQQQRVEELEELVAAPEPLPFNTSELCAPLGNRLFARLPPHEFKRVQKHLQPLWLLGGENIDLVGEAPAAIFPVQAILSLRTRHADGCTVEFASV